MWYSAFYLSHIYSSHCFIFFFFITVKVGQGQWVWCPWYGHSLRVTVPWLSYNMEATTSVHMKENKLCPWLSNYRQTERRGCAREQGRQCFSLISLQHFFNHKIALFTWRLSLCLAFSFPKYFKMHFFFPFNPLAHLWCFFSFFLKNYKPFVQVKWIAAEGNSGGEACARVRKSACSSWSQYLLWESQ